MSWALVANTSLSGSGTTSGINTTGANLITIHIGWASSLGGGLTITDNKGNSYTLRANNDNGTVQSRIYDFFVPSVGSGHTFTLSGAFPAMEVCAWSGAISLPFDVLNGANTVSGTSLQTGNVTPSDGNEMIFTGICIDVPSSNNYTINSGFSISNENDYTPGVNEGAVAAYCIETLRASKNPTWSWSGGAGGAATSIVVYKGLSVPFSYSRFI